MTCDMCDRAARMRVTTKTHGTILTCGRHEVRGAKAIRVEFIEQEQPS